MLVTLISRTSHNIWEAGIFPHIDNGLGKKVGSTLCFFFSLWESDTQTRTLWLFSNTYRWSLTAELSFCGLCCLGNSEPLAHNTVRSAVITCRNVAGGRC